MMKRIVVAASAFTLVAGGLAVAGLDPAGAAKPTITAGPGSHVNCHISSKAKLSPALKDNWIQADHQSDPDPRVRAIPNTTFASNGPVFVSSKTKTVSCSGTVTDGTNTAPVTGLKVTLVTDPAHPGTTDPATCANLVAPSSPSTARYNAFIKYKASGAKVSDSTITDASIGNSGAGFAVTGGTISGSFAGGTSSTQANVDGTTLGMFISSTAISPNAVSSTSPNGGVPCQASLKSSPKAVKLKKPKGIKKIGIDSSSSTIDISR
ncbi:MAG: hypothetical protein ACXV9P_02145 [Acidimicrobiia bacterium]